MHATPYPRIWVPYTGTGTGEGTRKSARLPAILRYATPVQKIRGPLTGYAMYATLRPMSLDFLTDVEFDVPTETRVKRGLESPVQKSTPGALQLGAINKITKARLAWAVAELTAMNLEKVSKWLDEAAKDSPVAAIDRLIELLKFTNPQQKSMTVENVPTDTTNFGNLTTKQLQALVFQPAGADGVVSEQ